MKLRIYSVAEKQPPIDENIFKISIRNGKILEIIPCKAILQTIEESEKQYLPQNVHHLMTWDLGDLGCFDMRYDDKWAFRTI